MRLSRDEINGKYYHVMVQGVGKEFIFPDDNCKGYYITCLQNAKSIAAVKILAFCVMGNHAHILVAVENCLQMSKFFHKANTDYAMYYNRIKKRNGYVFGERYKSEVITDEKYLITCLAYIQNNPLKAGLVQRAEDYKFSSYSNYILRSGLVDLHEAGKYYDTSRKNIDEIMAELTNTSYIEYQDNMVEDKHALFKEIVAKLGKNKEGFQTDAETIKLVYNQMKDSCKISIREFAEIANINREKLRKIIVK